MLEVASGAEAQPVVRIEHPDLVITDVLMPVMDGFELVRHIRLDPETDLTPVVFYTAHSGKREARELALSGGVAAVLTKPADSAEVLRVVARVLSGETESDAPRLATDYGREHLRLLTDKVAEKPGCAP